MHSQQQSDLRFVVFCVYSLRRPYWIMMSLAVRFLDGTAQQVDVTPETTFADLMSRIEA